MLCRGAWLLLLLLFAMPACPLSVERDFTSCASAPANPQDRRLDKDALTIVSWNVEWLFLQGVGSSNCPGSKCAWENGQQAQDHLLEVASIIATMDADILALMEVNDCEVLTKLTETNFLTSKGYKPYLLRGTDTSTNQNIGFLTRIDPAGDVARSDLRFHYPVSGSHCGDTREGDKGCSKHAYTHFSVPMGSETREILFVGLHLLAFPDSASRCTQREAQACVIQDIIRTEGISKGREIVVLGDFNDFSATVPDRSGSVPISRVLEIIGNPGSDVCGNPQERLPWNNTRRASSFRSLFQVAAGMSRDDRYTSWYDENGDCEVGPAELTSIDHMIVSNELAKRIVPNGANMGRYWGTQCGLNLFSDHWPIIARLDMS